MTDPVPPPRFRLGFWALLALVLAIAVALAARNADGTTLAIPNHALVRGGYLVIVVIVVGYALLGRGFGLRDIVTAAAGWVAIFLIIVGAYAYRSELLAGGGRILGVLVPGLPLSGQLAGQAANAVVIERTIDGHFVIRARLDKARATLILDTGASFVTLTPKDAARVGVDTGSLHFDTPIRTANGVIQAAPIVIDSLSVGSIMRHAVPALVAPPDTLDQSLLGMSFLNTLKSYAISGDRLVLTP